MTTEARAMIEHGYKIFPLQSNSKLPACRWQDEEVPAVDENQNYGVNCGKSGLVVIDIDGPKGIEQFEQLLGDRNYPNTFAVSTPRGGFHLYFKGTGIRNSAKQVAPDIDIRGDGGYVVGPGSVVGGKRYEIENDVEPLELPDWIKPRLDPNFKPVEAQWAVESRTAPVNGHDDYLKSQVFIYRLKGLDKEYAYALWLEEIDKLDTNPSDPFERKDFERHWKGADRKISVAEAKEAEEVKAAVGLFVYKDFSELDDTPFSYRIPGLLPDNCNVLFSAQYKAGKTTTAVNVVHAFTSHDDLFGEFPVSMVGGNVVYVNLELDEVMFRQYGEEAGITGKRLKILNLRGQARHIQIEKDAFIDAWASELKKLDTEILVVDPLSVIMAVNGYDSDNNDGARRVLEGFGAVQKMAGIDHVIVIDHSGHTNTDRSRGASAKMDWPDVIWSQEKNGSETTRKFKAYGRGVDEKSFTIARNPDTRRIETTIPADADRGDERTLLSQIEDNPGINTSQLKENTGWDKSYLSRRLTELERSGKVERTPGRGPRPDTWVLVSLVS